MDAVTADILLERLDKAETDSDRIASLAYAAKAQIRCTHSVGLRLHDVSDKINHLDETLDARIDRRVEKHLTDKFNSLESTIKACPARHALGIPKWKLGPINSNNVLYVIIVALLMIIAAQAGVDLGPLLGVK